MRLYLENRGGGGRGGQAAAAPRWVGGEGGRLLGLQGIRPHRCFLSGLPMIFGDPEMIYFGGYKEMSSILADQ
jgi:hypothetical protein